MTLVSRIRQPAEVPRPINSHVSDQEMEMTLLCGLPEKLEHLVVPIHAIVDVETLTTEFVKSDLLQEEQ